MADRVRVSAQDSREFRGTTFLQNGQRYESWLPVGLWEFAGQCNLTTGRGSSEMVRAEKLVACGAGAWGKWYVSPETAEALRGWVIV